MKKILIFQLSLLFYVSARANPVIPEGRLMVSEIYFEGSEWFVEAAANHPDAYPSDNLDSVIFETSSGQSYFKPGILLEYGEIIIITKDSLINPLSINPDGDFINMKEYEYGTDFLMWDLRWHQDIKFGNYEEATCTSPYKGQSLVLQRFEMETPGEGTVIFYWLVKENNPTPGSSPFTCDSRDTVSGFIYDKLLKPVNDAEIRYCSEAEYWWAYPGLSPIITNESGYFENAEMFSRIYNAQIICGNSVISNVSFNVEIDSSNIYDFIIENYVHAGIEMHEPANSVSLTNCPNPVQEQTTISVNIPQNIYFKKAIIKIFNANGQIVDIIPFPYNSNNIYNLTWIRSDNIRPGNYFINLDINSKRIASNNMLIIQ